MEQFPSVVRASASLYSFLLSVDVTSFLLSIAPSHTHRRRILQDCICNITQHCLCVLSYFNCEHTEGEHSDSNAVSECECCCDYRYHFILDKIRSETCNMRMCCDQLRALNPYHPAIYHCNSICHALTKLHVLIKKSYIFM